MSFFKRRAKDDELLQVPEPDKRREEDRREKKELVDRVKDLEDRVDDIADFLDIEGETAAGVQAEKEH